MSDKHIHGNMDRTIDVEATVKTQPREQALHLHYHSDSFSV